MKTPFPILYSDSLREILEMPSGWLMKGGIGCIAACLIVVLAGCWFIQYPEKVKAEVLLVNEQMPARLAPVMDGTLDEIHVHHLQRVEAGGILAVLENPARTQDVYLLRERFSDTSLLNPQALLEHPGWLEQHLVLGELEAAWLEVRSKALEVQHLRTIDRPVDRIKGFKRQSMATQNTIALLEESELNQLTICKLEESRYSRSETLYRNGLIPSEELETEKQKLLSYKQLHKDIQVRIQETKRECLNLDQTLLEESVNQSRTWSEQTLAYRNAVVKLNTAMTGWEQHYVIKTPISGTVSCSAEWQRKEAVRAGEELFAVVPEGSGAVIGWLKYPAQSPGQVKAGQTVFIRIDHHPYLESGILKGIVASTSLLPDSEHRLTARVRFSDGLTTSYGRRLQLDGEWTGSAEIHVRKLRLLERIWNPLRYLGEQLSEP